MLALPLRRTGMADVERGEQQQDTAARYRAVAREVRDNNVDTANNSAFVETGERRLAVPRHPRLQRAHLHRHRPGAGKAPRSDSGAGSRPPAALPGLSRRTGAARLRHRSARTAAPTRRRPGRTSDGAGTARARAWTSPSSCACRPSTASNRCSPIWRPCRDCIRKRSTRSPCNWPAKCPPSPVRPSADRHRSPPTTTTTCKTFGALIGELRRSLSLVEEQAAIRIPIEERQYGIRVAIITDRERPLLTKATFILAVRADMATDLLRARFPTQVKIGPVERIAQFVNHHLPGIGVSALPVAPREIPYQADFIYFRLDRSSEFWKQVLTSGGFAFHVGGEFPGLDMAFWAIKE